MADTAQKCIDLSSEEMVRGYEQMRVQALERQWTSCDFGQALFMCSGMMAWMNAWSKYRPQTEPVETTQPGRELHLPADIRGGIVMGVVNMVLNTRDAYT